MAAVSQQPGNNCRSINKPSQWIIRTLVGMFHEKQLCRLVGVLSTFDQVVAP